MLVEIMAYKLREIVHRNQPGEENENEEMYALLRKLLR